MPYTPTVWTDEVPATTPVKYKITDDTSGVLANSAKIEVVTSITPGTSVCAANLNKLEEGVEDAQAAAEAAQADVDAAIPKSLLTTAGDIIYATASAVLARLGIGAAGSIARSTGSAPSWLAPGSDFTTLISRAGAANKIEWAGIIGSIITRSTEQSIPNDTETAISSFDSETLDSNGFHTGTGATIVIPSGYESYYLLLASGYFASHATAGKLRQIGFSINGGGAFGASSFVNDGASATWVNAMALVFLSAADTVGMVVTQIAGTSLNFYNARLSVVMFK